MRDTGTSERSAPGGVLTGWISRLDLALELDLTVDTLRRWEARRFGPPCVRAGRKVYSLDRPLLRRAACSINE